MSAAKGQLRRMGPRVARVSRGHKFFLIVAPEHFTRGSPPVDWWLDDYVNWLKHPYYLALQSAASTHGSNPQSIQVTQVMTDTPRRPITVGQQRVIFFVKRGIERTPTQEVRGAFSPTKVSTPAATGFDLIRYATRIGGIGRAVETLRPLLPLIRGAELRAVLDAENEKATAQRLGYVLEKTGNEKLATVIDGWLPAIRPVLPLATTAASSPQAPVTARWHVLDNTGEFSACPPLHAEM
ncbi:MAG: type IV toxin-antitoxin system AbiEi family antitoxin [Lacunisphaera sp.]|nr:type IV toxin-antitoxin system AbiEi family antitoxin [Lacunisphaera sp.]